MHLNVRSSYSLLSGLMDVEDIAKRAKLEGMKAIALTDLHVLHGSLNFQKACSRYGVKPIFGMDITLNDNTVITALARNEDGYKALISISYILSKEHSVSLELLSSKSDDLVIIAHGEGGPFEASISKGHHDEVLNLMGEYKSKFKFLYLGISHQESPFFNQINNKLIELARNIDLKCTAMTKVLYENAEDSETYRVVRAIDKGTYLEDLTLVSSPNRHFLSLKEMQTLYDQCLIDTIDEIISMCDLDVYSLKTSLPHYETNSQVDVRIYLAKLAQLGLNKRLEGKVTSDYQERLNYELKIINDMDFSDYFLIVYDVIRFAKKEGIYVGPGRGSSAGSLVAYSLGITDVDPMEYGLLFERFLNPMRISMPDIDIDFPDDKRDIVVKYAKDKYGENRVGHIVTFGTMKAKQAFRDVSRVFQIPTRTVDAIAKLITASKLQENFDNVPKFRSMIVSDKKLLSVFNYALKIEGLMRHTSLHAAGIVISNDPLIDVVPIIDTGNELDVIQYDMSDLEKLGLIKIDFLGLRNLTIIDNIVSKIKIKNPEFNISKIPLDDIRTFKMLSEGDTVGLFQLESEGMKNLLKKLKPYRFMDIVDTIALYRPGPMENIPLYLESRANSRNVRYLHEDLKAITESTYGVLVYQEQIMQVAQLMAGFNLAKADILRKAMGKKDATQLSKLRDEFISGVISKGYDAKLGPELYDLIEKFANYGFNKSHSVAYGLVSYQMAYLKANYPGLFYTYLLTSVIGSDHKIRQYIDECRKRGVTIHNPDIVKSRAYFTIQDSGIRVPLTMIKGISTTTTNLIVKEVVENGSYKSYYDAISRLTLRGIRRGHLESLIKAGAFNCFPYNKATMLGNLDEALRYTNIIKVENEGKLSLNSDLVSEPRITILPENQKEALDHEFSVLGMYLSEHPTMRYKKAGITNLNEMSVGGTSIDVVVMIDAIKTHKTKHGDTMAFLGISDNTGNFDAVVFPKVYERISSQLKVGSIVVLNGKLQKEDSFIINGLNLIQK